MLVLKRNINEEIVIDTGDEVIRLVVVAATMSYARIGIDAPKHFAVHRKEVYEAIQAEKQLTPPQSG